MAENKFAKYKQNKFAKYKQEPQPAPQGFQPYAQAPMQPQGMDAAMNKAKGLTFNDLGNFADSTVRMLGNGVTLGYGDKMAAAVDAGLGQGDYTKNLAENRAQTETSRDTAGTAGVIAEIGGSILPAAKLAQLGATATRLPGAVGKYFGMGIDGAALGGVTAAGNDQNVGTGMMFGAAGGAAGQAVGAAVSGLASKVAAFKRAPSEQAAAEIDTLIQSMKGNPAELKAQVEALGPDAMLIDALGERGGALARRSANINPDARELLETPLQARKASQNLRVTNDIGRLTGLDAANAPTVEFLKKSANDASRPAINAAYNEAKAAGFDLDLKDFSHILETPMGASAKGKGLSAVRNRAFDAPQPENTNLLPIGQKPVATEVKPNYAQARRAVESLVPSMGKRPAKPQDLLDYVISKGGVRDAGGELRSFDFNKTRKGQLATRINAGRDLDEMREAAAQDGYLDELYGNPRDAVSQSTTADFIDLLGRNYSGKPVFSGKDIPDVEAWKQFKDYQGARSNFRTIGKQVAEKMGRGADEKQLREVISRVDRGENIDDAIESVKYADAMENGVAPQDVPIGMNGEKVRNFSNLEWMDSTKRALDDVASSSFRSGMSDRGSQASELAKALRLRVDEKVPEYAGARKLRQAAYRKDDAFDLGQSLGRGRIDLDTPRKVGDVAPENRDAVKQAFGSELIERLLNKNSTDGALNMLDTPMFKDASKSVLGDDSAELARALSREKIFNKSQRAVAGNSTTARQLAEMFGGGMIGGTGALLTGQDLLTGGIGGAALGLTRRGSRALLDKIASGKAKAVAPELAKLLTQKVLPKAPDKSKFQKMIERNKELLARLIAGGTVGASLDR